MQEKLCDFLWIVPFWMWCRKYCIINIVKYCTYMETTLWRNKKMWCCQHIFAFPWIRAKHSLQVLLGKCSESISFLTSLKHLTTSRCSSWCCVNPSEVRFFLLTLILSFIESITVKKGWELNNFEVQQVGLKLYSYKTFTSTPLYYVLLSRNLVSVLRNKI